MYVLPASFMDAATIEIEIREKSQIKGSPNKFRWSRITFPSSHRELGDIQNPGQDISFICRETLEQSISTHEGMHARRERCLES